MGHLEGKKKLSFPKPRYTLGYPHKLGIGVLLVLAAVFLCHPQAYKRQWEDVPSLYFSFLQEGDYVLDYMLSAPPAAGSSVRVISETAVDSGNNVGVEFARKELVPGESRGSLSLHLAQGVRGIQVLQDSGEGAVFSEFKIQSVQLLCTDHYLMSMLCLMSALCICLLGLYVPVDRYKLPLLAAGFGLLASLPMANDFLIETVPDTGFHLARLESVYRGLRAGDFPVRIGSVQMGGYGSLSAVMYPQLFLYPVALLRFFRVSLLACYKLLVAGLNVGSALLAFYAVKNICKSEKTGIIASFLYAFSAYRLIDVYQRGALGESLAMAFLPLIMWGIYEILWGNRRRWPLLALGVSAVLQSHVLSVEMCVFFLVAAVALRCLQRGRGQLLARLLAGVKAAALTVLLNASFLVPFLYFCGEDLQCFHMPNELTDSLLYFNQMFFSFPHADGANRVLGSLSGEMPLTVGGVLLLGMILFAAVASRKDASEAASAGRHEKRVGACCLAFGLAALLLTSWIFPWEALSRIPAFDAIARSMQFAWRFLGPASLFLCVTAAVGLKLFEERSRGRGWIYGCAVLLVFLSATYFFEMSARESVQTGDKMAVNGYDITDALYMYYDGESFKAHHLNPEYRIPQMRSAGQEAAFSGLRRCGSRLWVEVTPGTAPGDVLIFPIYYYPGYRISVNGEAVEGYNYGTMLACSMPLGHAEVEVRYTGPAAFRIGDIISLCTVIACVIYIPFSRRRK